MECVHLLLRHGHSRADIFDVQQPGFPYRGWSFQQFEMFAAAAARAAKAEVADGVDSVRLGIASIFGDKATGAKIERLLRLLRTGKKGQ